MADKRITELTEKQTVEDGDYLIVDNGTSGTKKMTVEHVLKAKTTRQTASVMAGTTSVTFSEIPTTDDYIIELYTDKAGLEYTNVDDSISGQLTYTFEPQSTTFHVYLIIKEVF